MKSAERTDACNFMSGRATRHFGQPAKRRGHPHNKWPKTECSCNRKLRYYWNCEKDLFGCGRRHKMERQM